MYLRGNMLSRLALSVILVVATAAFARAGATTPTLIVQSASMPPGSTRLVSFAVAYDYSNAIQANYDIELIVFQGNSFARFPVSGAARVGSSAALADGLAVADLPALDAASTPAPDGVRVVTIEPTRLAVMLTTFTGGAATAVLAATVDEGVILSNPLSFNLP
jgi:hypothetical protein